LSAEGIGRTVIWAAIVIVVVIILAVIAIKLLGYLVVAPLAYATTEDTKDIAPQDEEQEQKEVDKETIDIGNDTEVTVTCTSNIPNLVSCD
jgi:Tfp pilus assembly protein PilO